MRKFSRCLNRFNPFTSPVYFHTGLPGNSTPWQIVDLAERFPEIDFLMGHCGSLISGMMLTTLLWQPEYLFRNVIGSLSIPDG